MAFVRVILFFGSLLLAGLCLITALAAVAEHDAKTALLAATVALLCFGFSRFFKPNRARPVRGGTRYRSRDSGDVFLVDSSAGSGCGDD